jgi:hypothetical protein
MVLVTQVRRLTVVVITAALFCAGCSSSGTTAPPSPSPSIDLTGTWRGNFALAGVSAEMAWTLTQTGSAVSGPILVRLPNGVVLLNGFLTGTLTGSTLPYLISVGPGGIPSQPACVGQLGGTMTAAIGPTSTLTGSYAVTSATCTPPFGTTGDLLLTRG